MIRPPHDSAKGTPSRQAYQRGCRCRECTDFNTAYARTNRPVSQPKSRRRGRSCYVSVPGGCGHPECIQANRDYQRRYMALRRSGITWVDPLIEQVMR